MQIYFVVPDYFETRPKPCMNGLGIVFLAVTPDGTALPCHAARMLPGLEFPNVRERDVRSIWYDSRGLQSLPRRGVDEGAVPQLPGEAASDFGGCRCQAYLLTGDAANADPVCELSPHHHLVTAAVARGRAAPCSAARARRWSSAITASRSRSSRRAAARRRPEERARGRSPGTADGRAAAASRWPLR